MVLSKVVITFIQNLLTFFLEIVLVHILSGLNGPGWEFR